MSLTELAQRISVFAAFAALAAAAAGTFIPVAPAAAPTVADLAALEAKMTADARLHAVAAIPAPPAPAPWCAECHPGLPHPGAGVARALLNAHAVSMDCLLCHWPAAAGSRPVQEWRVQAGAAAFLAVLPPDRSSKEQLSALRSAATAGRRCFDRGPACGGCHRPGGIGNLARPGSAPARVAALERLEHPFTLAPGEKWYFPQIR